MKAFALLLVLLTTIVRGQSPPGNLVPNWSFEEQDSCQSINLPNGSNIFYTHAWFSPFSFPGALSGGGVELFSHCSSDPTLLPPHVEDGYQVPYDGLNFAGIYLSYSLSREYIEVGLTDSLVAGRCYRLQFHYAYSDSSTVVCDGLGAYFSDDSLMRLTQTFFPILVDPQMALPDSFVTADTAHWLTFVDSFTAQGGERFVTIGNFKPDSLNYCLHIRPDGEDGPHSYMFIDAVVLLPCDSPNVVTAVPPRSKPTGELFPNPASDAVTYRMRDANAAAGYRIEVTDLLGRVLIRQPLIDGTAAIDTRALSSGVYSVCCYGYDQPVQRSKLVVRRQ